MFLIFVSNTFQKKKSSSFVHLISQSFKVPFCRLMSSNRFVIIFNLKKSIFYSQACISFCSSFYPSVKAFKLGDTDLFLCCFYLFIFCLLLLRQWQERNDDCKKKVKNILAQTATSSIKNTADAKILKSKNRMQKKKSTEINVEFDLFP